MIYCTVLYGEFLEWPKHKLQGPLEKQDELTNTVNCSSNKYCEIVQVLQVLQVLLIP